jgi:spore coat polysaccharide biosynthesis protein SpsF
MATVILQARVGSTRLPGKALLPILDKPMLWYCIESLKRSPAINRVVMAIPDKPSDLPLVELAETCGIDVFRGSELDVLKRFYDAAAVFKDDYYFRATGDNPIIDIDNPGRILSHLKANRLDYVAERGLPVGTVVEAFTFKALERAFVEGSSPEDREHVTWYIKKSGTFNIDIIDGPPEVRLPQLSLTVDYPEEFERISYFIENLYTDGIPDFKEVVAFARKDMRI